MNIWWIRNSFDDISFIESKWEESKKKATNNNSLKVQISFMHHWGKAYLNIKRKIATWTKKKEKRTHRKTTKLPREMAIFGNWWVLCDSIYDVLHNIG